MADDGEVHAPANPSGCGQPVEGWSFVNGLLQIAHLTAANCSPPASGRSQAPCSGAASKRGGLAIAEKARNEFANSGKLRRWPRKQCAHYGLCMRSAPSRACACRGRGQAHEQISTPSRQTWAACMTAEDGPGKCRRPLTRVSESIETCADYYAASAMYEELSRRSDAGASRARAWRGTSASPPIERALG
jgi:hypothetical protein